MGKVATSPLPSQGSPPLQSRGTKSEVAHLLAKWLRYPCRLGDPHRFRAGGQNQKWPTCGQSGYVTPAVSGIPTASERGDKIRSGPLVGKVATSPLPSRGSPPLQSGGTKSEVAHLWAKWLRHPCRLGDPHRFRAGGQNQKWPTCWQGGYVTPAVSGIPTASNRGHKIRSGPLVGKVATSPLPSKMLYSGSVRCAKQTLPPTKGGGFGYVKTLLLPKILAPMLSFSAETPPHPWQERQNKQGGGAKSRGKVSLPQSSKVGC